MVPYRLLGEGFLTVKSITEVPNQPGTYLVHCRPCLVFHLGHLRMLNFLYSLLLTGKRVIILINTYDEHDPTNRTLNRRLAEEVTITRGFYSAYLGFDEPYLTIKCTSDLLLEKSALIDIQRQYADLYSNGDPRARYLIEMHGRSWASPNILFVPKCIAAIENLNPDALIAGEKHRPIAECFDAILQRRGNSVPSYLFPDLLDLRMVTGMDHTRSVETYIDVSEQEDFILYKLNILRNEPELLSKWLEHFMQYVFLTAPERTKAGLGDVHILESAKVLALTRFLSNVRSMVPYGVQRPVDSFKVSWSDDLYRAVTSTEKMQIERIAAAIYSDSPCKLLSIYRIFGGGQSGSQVYGVREYDDAGAVNIANLSVLKIGPANDLLQEAANYKRFVAHRRTAAFMAVKAANVIVDTTSGLVYEDANRFLGVGEPGQQLEPLSSIFAPGKYTFEQIGLILRDLFSQHLYEVLYKHGVRKEVLKISYFLNEFLPASYSVKADTVEEIDHSAQGINGSHIITHIVLADSDIQRRMARGYTIGVHERVDIDLSSVSEIDLSRILPDAEITLGGTITDTRRTWFQKLVDELGLRYERGKLWVDTGNFVDDPLPALSSILQSEYRGVTQLAIHGDLHAGNVLWGAGRCGIIDYGKMRAAWPSLYDIAFLLADLKSYVTSRRMDIDGIIAVEHSFASARGRLSRDKREMRDLLRVFEYESQPPEVQALGPRNLFYGLMACVFLGRLKYGLRDQEKKVSLVLADWAMRRLT